MTEILKTETLFTITFEYVIQSHSKNASTKKYEYTMKYLLLDEIN